MIRPSKWKIFDKSGSPIGLFANSYVDLRFDDPHGGTNASAYLITGYDGTVDSIEVTNSGYMYDPSTTTVYYNSVLGDGEHEVPAGTVVSYTDVSVFNPLPANVKGIESITMDSSIQFMYPSVVYNGNVYMNPVSQGLVETEHLFFLEETSTGYVRPFDTEYATLVLQFVGNENEISFFQVDEASQTVLWTDIISVSLGPNDEVNTQYYNANDNVMMNTGVSPITVNIGFRSDEEGVYKRTMRIYNVVGGEYYTIAEIDVNAQSIGEDERFRALIENFGLPDPLDMPKVFKETDINEDMLDYQVLNYKSKHMILEHSNIMPFIGTYKGLINAIKWLGYDDITIREWFKNVKDGRKLSLQVPFDAKDRLQTMLSFTPDQRKTLKKLNQLSINYCMTRETGDVDEYGVPITENCYSYSIDEVLIKLFALKDWLEKNIIGVNARIIDITGEGVYFDRYSNAVYSTGSLGFSDFYEESMTPYSF